MLESSQNKEYKSLAKGWQKWLDYTKSTVRPIFYRGNGKVCAVVTLNQSLPVHHVSQSYACEGTAALDDPYEGELFTWWLYFFGRLSKSEKESLWKVKRAKLISVEYEMGGIGPITVQKGEGILLSLVFGFNI